MIARPEYLVPLLTLCVCIAFYWLHSTRPVTHLITRHADEYNHEFVDSFLYSADPLPSSIPQIIHQSWKSADLPESFIRFSQSWKSKNPGFEYRLWTDEDNDDLVALHYPQFREFYASLPKAIMRADMVRALYLHRHGGVYADLDTWCLRPIDGFIDSEPILLAHMSMDYQFAHDVPNAWMASVPGHPFWVFFVNTMISSYNKDYGAEQATGPVALKRALEFWQHHSLPIKVLRPGIVYLRDWHNFIANAGPIFDRICDGGTIDTEETESNCKKKYPEAAVLTFWAHSWEGKGR